MNNSDIPTLEFHPLSEIFPLIEGDELTKLVSDIKENGLLDPIILLDGQILDGRNRYHACAQANVTPTYHCYGDSGVYDNLAFEASVKLLGDLPDPFGFVKSRNIHRRHLSQTQRAAAGAKLLEWYEAQAHERKVSALLQNADLPLGPNGPHGDNQQLTSDNADSEQKGRSADKAGKEVGVSGRSVKRAKQVYEKGTPELQKAIENDSIKVAAAAEIASLPKEQQNQALTEAQAKKKEPRPKKAAEPAQSKKSETEELKAKIADLEDQVETLLAQNESLERTTSEAIKAKEDIEALLNRHEQGRAAIDQQAMVNTLKSQLDDYMNLLAKEKRLTKALQIKLGEKS